MGENTAVVWPTGARWDEHGELILAGVPASELAAAYGTPLYVLDEADLRVRARRIVAAFRDAFEPLGTSVDVYYAGKAFLSVAVARWVAEESLCVDTCSAGEMAVAERAGVPADRIGLHGNNKSDDEIITAVRRGIGRIVIDSLEEIDRVARVARSLGVRARVMVRVKTGVHAGGHEFIATAHEDQKFGLSLADGSALKALRRLAAEPDAFDLVGIHNHIGSQIQDPDAYALAVRKLLALRARLNDETGVLLAEVDLGGGFGIAYQPGEHVLDVRALAQMLADTVAEECEALGTAIPRLSVEPGRSIVGPAGVTLYSVGTVKPVTVGGEDAEVKVRTYVSVDGGMSDNIRPALYGALYTATLANRSSARLRVPSRVVGKHCEAGDVIIPDIELPADIHRGDLLAVPATGAYGRSMASNYNMLPRPAVVAVKDGAVQVLMRRETIDDLLALDEG